MIEPERWKFIEGFNKDYQISSYGRVRSFKQSSNGKIYVGNKCSDDYRDFTFYKNGKCHRKLIHRLVIKYFKQSKRLTEHTHHKNTITFDNFYKNLKPCSASQNITYCVKNGTNNPPRGERQGSSILTKKDIKYIRKAYKEGKYSQQELADQFGVGQPHISDIVNYNRWEHIK